MGGSIKKAFSNPIRAATTISTFGTSEFARRTPIGNQVFSAPEKFANGLIGTKFGQEGVPDMAAVTGGMSNPDLLAQTGGAPVLAQIAMGVDPKQALAGFLGVNPDDWDNYVAGLSPKDASALKATQGVLQSIQENTNVRNQAVQRVIADFPNLSMNVAKERSAAGEEFDEATKGAIEQALKGTASKYAASGGISSGAANEAFARVGAEHAMDKLAYMGDREAVAKQDRLGEYQAELGKFNARLSEVNALRDFQNTMITGKASEGFSAAQANLGRIQNADITNTGYQNQERLQRQKQDSDSQNALFGALGSLGGSVIGGNFLNKQIASSTLNTTPNTIPKFKTSSYDGYSGRA